MNEFEKDEDKRLMLEKMRENGWETETNEESTYEEVERDFNEMVAEFEAIERDIGIDYESEDFDD